MAAAAFAAVRQADPQRRAAILANGHAPSFHACAIERRRAVVDATQEPIDTIAFRGQSLARR